MTAFVYREFTLACDEAGCLAHYGPFGVERTRGALRKLAAKDGWTRVLSPSGRKHDWDYCPQHKRR